MRLTKITLGSILTLTLAMSACAFAADSAPAPVAEHVAITSTAATNEMREYNVNVSIKGSMPNPDTNQPVNLDTTLCLKIVHKYTRREGDGLLPMEITLIEGSALTNGQKLSIAPSIYPKLTVLLDTKFNISDIFGISPSSYSASLPGINYGNMIILFYLPDGDKPHAVGDKWDSKVTLPSLGETYNFSNMIKSIDTVDGVKVATINQEITRAPKNGETKPTLRATVESAFALDTGKLMKSHVDCGVAFGPQQIAAPDAKNREPSKQDQSKASANIKMDIVLAK